MPENTKTPNYKLRRRVAAGLFAPVALAGAGYGVTRGADRASGLAAAEASFSSKDAKAFSHQGVITVPYEVGSAPQDQLVSEIVSDMHPYAPNQDPLDAYHVVQTYLPEADRDNYLVRPHEKFDFVVDTAAGRILPNPASSADPKQ